MPDPRRIGGLLLPQQSEPAAPPAGTGALYFKTDGKVYKKLPDGTESEVGAGGYPDELVKIYAEEPENPQPGDLWLDQLADPPQLVNEELPGEELGYGEGLSSFTFSSTTFVDVPGLDLSVVVGTRPVYVMFDCMAAAINVVNGRVIVAILEDGNIVGQAWAAGTTTVNRPMPLHRIIRRSPSPGQHTYKAQVRVGDAGNGIIYSNDIIVGGGGMSLSVVTA